MLRPLAPQRQVGQLEQHLGARVEPGGLLQRDQGLAEPAEPGLLHLGQLAETGGGEARVGLGLGDAGARGERRGQAGHVGPAPLQGTELAPGEQVLGLDLQHLGQGAGGDLEIRGQVLGRDRQAAEEPGPVRAVARELGERREAADEERAVAPGLAERHQPLERRAVSRVGVDRPGEERLCAVGRGEPRALELARLGEEGGAADRIRHGGRGALQRPGQRGRIARRAPGGDQRLERLRIVRDEGERGLPVLAGLHLVAEPRRRQRGQRVVRGVGGAANAGVGGRRTGELHPLLVAGDRLGDAAQSLGDAGLRDERHHVARAAATRPRGSGGARCPAA